MSLLKPFYFTFGNITNVDHKTIFSLYKSSMTSHGKLQK